MKSYFWIMLFFAIVTGCADEEKIELKSNSGINHTYDILLTSNANNLPQGRGVIYFFVKCTDSTCDESEGEPFHGYEGVTTVDNQLRIFFTVSFTGYYFLSIYIDVDNSKNLTAGDLVWGPNPDSIWGYTKHYSETDSYWYTSEYYPTIWEEWAVNSFGGYSIYTGTERNYSLRSVSTIYQPYDHSNE